MTSIMTNISAYDRVAEPEQHQQDPSTTQYRISTGLRVADASDNAAYWSIATTMRSDKRRSRPSGRARPRRRQGRHRLPGIDKAIDHRQRDQGQAGRRARSGRRQGQDPGRNHRSFRRAGDRRRRRHLLRLELGSSVDSTGVTTTRKFVSSLLPRRFGRHQHRHDQCRHRSPPGTMLIEAFGGATAGRCSIHDLAPARAAATYSVAHARHQ